MSLIALGTEVQEALAARRPVVALETAVVTHGLPAPHNLEAVRRMEAAIRHEGGVPAVCLVKDGCLLVGAAAGQVEAAACDPDREKASVRDLGAAVACRKTAGLTVSATLFAAQQAGISVFATGGIGGVHRGAEETGDVSSDLPQLSRSPVLTVCAGAKSVLDIPRTLEYLETLGVPVFGYRTAQFPAFYLTSSGLTVPPVESPAEAAAVARTQWALGIEAGVVIGVPIPAAQAITPDEWQAWMGQAERTARREHVQGKAVTPFLLAQVADLSAGRTVQANLALLENNARVAAQIAAALLS